MFTYKELDVIIQALGNWKGVFGTHKKEDLKKSEMAIHHKSLLIRDSLIKRIEEEIMDRYDIKLRVAYLEELNMVNK
jgi:hypothetical protein